MRRKKTEIPGYAVQNGCHNCRENGPSYSREAMVYCYKWDRYVSAYGKCDAGEFCEADGEGNGV